LAASSSEGRVAFSFEDFPDFGRQYLFGLRLLRSDGALVTAIDDLAETLASQHVRHVELTTTTYSHFHGGMSREHYREELNEGRRLAAARGVSICWVVDVPRDLEIPSPRRSPPTTSKSQCASNSPRSQPRLRRRIR
jgi:aminodeoxyfutalosine deaminase